MVYNNIAETEYKKILENMPILCVDLVIHHFGRVLLVHRINEPAKGLWWLPGGRVHKNEKLKDAAIREAWEEVGIKIQIEKKIGAYEAMFKEGPFKNLKNGVHTVAVCFRAKPLDKNPKIKIDKTSSGYKWINNIEEKLDPYVKEIIKDSGVFNEK